MTERSTAKAQATHGRVLVTGAAGFVGRHLVRELIDQGRQVRATDLGNLDEAKDLGAETAAADLTVPDQVEEVLEGVDTVAHVAAAYDLSLPRETLMRVNVGTTSNLARASADRGVAHLVFCSTADTYGMHAESPIHEHFSQRPLNDYARSKVAAEQKLLAISGHTGLQVTIVRPTLIYGPGSIYIASLFCTLPYILQRQLGFIPRATGGPRINAVHVQDVAGAIAHLVGRTDLAGQAFNLADDQWQTVGDLLDNLTRPLGLRTSPVAFPLGLVPLDPLASLVERLPAQAFGLMNRVLRHQWEQIVNAHGLTQNLSPRFDADFVSYGHGDHVYANARLKATGYTLRWPRFDVGYPATIDWYQKQRWIPGPPA